MGFVGAQCSEPRLIEIAYAFEQATKRRVAPRVGVDERRFEAGHEGSLTHYPAVNRRVAGSSPARGANPLKQLG